MTYPDTPGFQAHSATSRAAAEQLHSINTMEGQILDRLAISEVGWTADELHQHLETLWPSIQSGTVAARLRGLQLKGKIVKGAVERKTRSGRLANEWWLKETADKLVVRLAESAPEPMTATEIELRKKVTHLELEHLRLMSQFPDTKTVRWLLAEVRPEIGWPAEAMTALVDITKMCEVIERERANDPAA